MCSLECHSSLEGAEGAAMKIQGVTNFKLMKFVIPSSFSSGVNVLMHVGSNEGLLTVKDCSFTKKGDEREELTDYGLIKAEEGTVVLEFVSMQSLCFSQDVISVLSTTILNLKNLTMKNLELNGSSGLSVSKSSGREKNEVEQDVVIEWSIFEEVTQNTTNDIPIIRNDNDNQLKILIRNTTMKRCGGLKCEKGGGMFYALNEGGSLDCSFCTISECFCSTKGRGGWLFLECASVVEQPLNFVLSNITFKDNSALRGRDVFVKCTDLDSQISESQFLINFGEPFAKDLAIWGCTADNYGDEEDLLGRVYVFRSEFIFVSSIVGNSSNSKNCGEMKSACSSLNTGVSHVIPSDYSQLYIWNETTLTGSCSAQKVTIKSMESNRNAEIKVNEIDFADEGAVTTSESVRFEKVSFVFGGMQNVVCSCLIHQLNGSLILESVLFLSENRTTEDSQILFDFSLIVVEEGLFEAEKCNVGHLKFSKPVFNILHSERATFDDVGMDDVECKSSAIECGKSEKLSVSKLAVTNIDLEERSLISLENSHSSLVLSLELSSFTNISQSTSGSCIVCTTHPMSGFGMCNCSFHECTSKLKKGSQVETTSVEKILIESCVFKGRIEERNENNLNREGEMCRWNGSVVDIVKSSVMMKDTTILNSPDGGITMSGGAMTINDGRFENNNPSIEGYPSQRRNIICSDSGTLNVMSLKGGDGLERNTSLWMLNDGCSFEGIVSERASPFFIPVLESVEAKEEADRMKLTFKGMLLVPCNLSFSVVKKKGEEKEIEHYDFDSNGFLSEREVEGSVGKDLINSCGDEIEVSAHILFGNVESSSSTQSFILKNASEIVQKGDERIVESGKEGNSYWIVIVTVFAVLFLIVLIISIVLAIRWRKARNEAKDLREIVNDNIRKDPKAFEMVTMEMSPEEQWRRAEREAEKKNEERIKKRVYDKTLEHSESSEHLLSESGSTEYILGRDSDKIPEWALEKEEVEEIRKRTPSPSISSTSTTSTTDSDSTFVRMEDMCPTTSSMSNLVDAMACSSPHEKLIVDLRDSLFMLLHGRNEKKEMAIGSLKEREQTAAQILFWVANLALHSFDEMENPLQSLANLSPHIVLFSEHMVICVVMHSDFISSDDSDSSSISSSTVVTSASDDDDSDSLPSSAFEDEDDYKKECLRWMAPELLMNRKMGATKKSVVFSIGMMLWECLTLEIPFGEYPAEVAGQKIANGERPDFLKTEGRNQGGLIIACTRTESEDRISLGDVKRELIGNFPPGAAMLTMTDALGLIQESECNERESNEIGTEDEFENMKIE